MTELTTEKQELSLSERISKESNLTVAVYTFLSVSISTIANALLDKPEQSVLRNAVTSLAPALGVILTYILLYFAMRKKKGDVQADSRAFFDKKIDGAEKKIQGYLSDMDNASDTKKDVLKKLIEEEQGIIKIYNEKKIELYMNQQK